MGGNLKLEGILKDKAERMLAKVGKIFRENNIKYTLEGGTLLGIVRENRLLPWDNDMDLTTTQDELKKLKKLRFSLWKAGYRVRFRYYKKDVLPFKKGEIRMMKIQTRKFYFFKEFALLDVFIKKRIDDKYYWTVTTKNPILKSVPAEFYDNLTEIDFLYTKFSIPKKCNEYLTYRYGDWKTPVKEYDFTKDDNAINNKRK